MSMSPEDTFDPELLDLRLGRLNPTQAEECRQRIAADAKLVEQDEALAGVIRSLGTWQDVPPPIGLKDRIAKRVAEAGPAPRIIRMTDELTESAEEAQGRVIRLGNLREIVAVAAIIVLMIGVGVPSLLNMRERNQRLGCSQNLALLGQGVQQYASVFGSSLPFAGWNSHASWRPSEDPRMETQPNRRHVYPLLRGAYVNDPRVFICPARGGVPMPSEQVDRRSDFIESRNVSYAYFNMADVRPSLSDNPNLPIMSDDNPIFEDGVPLFERLGLGDPASRNSPAHHGAGQNILMLDGHLKWATTPLAGINDDNIWTLQGVDKYTGREGPKSSTDAHLIK